MHQESIFEKCPRKLSRSYSPVIMFLNVKALDKYGTHMDSAVKTDDKLCFGKRRGFKLLALKKQRN